MQFGPSAEGRGPWIEIREPTVVTRGITFDVDGTLYSTRAVRLCMGWKNLGRLRVLRVGLRVREELRGRDFADAAAMRAEEARLVGKRTDRNAAAARVALDDIFDRCLTECLQRRSHLRTQLDLEALVALGVKIAVVSDRRVDDKLAAMGLSALPWGARVSADETGWLKPSPRPFLHACEALGLPPDHVVHIGDRIDSDGAGARAAGMGFVAVDGPQGLEAAIARALDADGRGQRQTSS